MGDYLITTIISLLATSGRWYLPVNFAWSHN